MRRLLFLFVLSLSICLPVVAQDVDKAPLITVVGTAEIQVQPDEAIFLLVVTKTDKDLQTAKRLNDESVAKVLELTRRFTIAPQNVKTDFISVEMKYDMIRDPRIKIPRDAGDEVGKKVFTGYEVSKIVIVKLTDISRFEEFFSDVLKTGITEVERVRFETSKLRENKDKARDLAMKAAREKAVALAAAVGQTIGKAVRIAEVNQNRDYPSNVGANVSGSFSQSIATFAVGTITVEAQVTVSFLLN